MGGILLGGIYWPLGFSFLEIVLFFSYLTRKERDICIHVVIFNEKGTCLVLSLFLNFDF